MEDKELSACRPMEDLQGFLAVGESSATGRSCESGQDFMEGELACSGRMGTAQQLLQGKMKARGLTGELKSIKRWFDWRTKKHKEIKMCVKLV